MLCHDGLQLDIYNTDVEFLQHIFPNTLISLQFPM